MIKLHPSLSTLVIFAGLLSPVTEVLARSPHFLPSTSTAGTELSLNFPSGPQREGTQATVGGGRRGGPSVGAAALGGKSDFSYCTDSSQSPLTVLTPQNRIATSISPNPSLYWFIPRTTATSAEFVVLNKHGQFLYSQYFELPGKSGVVKIDLPQTLALNLNQSYRWKFSLVCDPLDRSYDEYVWGILQRTKLDAAQEANLKQANNPADAAHLYAQFYAWNETMALVAQMRDTAPNEWQELLNSVGIDNQEVIDAPFLGTLE